MLLGIKDCPPYLVCYIGKLYAALGSVLKTFPVFVEQVLRGVGRAESQVQVSYDACLWCWM